jgi:hypothetical protein
LICGFTRELISRSNADTLVRALLPEYLEVGLATILLDTTAGDSTRPAGLRYNIAATAATGGGGVAAMANDLASLAAAVAPIAGDQILFVASPKQAAKINLLRAAPMPYPVLASAGLEDGVVLALATNALAVAGGNDPPRISVATEPVLHFDTAPQPISSEGTPNVAAAPTRSLFQTDCVAFRMIADLTWALRASGAVAWTQSVTW